MTKLFWFAGGRNLDEAAWAKWMQAAMDRLPADSVVAVGCATGADRLAARWAIKRGLKVIIAAVSSSGPAWVRKAEAAGAKVYWGVGGGSLAGRTRWLAAKVVAAGGALVALPGGAGTALSIRLARDPLAQACGVRVRIVRPNEAGGDAPPLLNFDYLGHTSPFVEVPKHDVINALVYLDGLRPLASPATIQGNTQALRHAWDYFGHPVPKRVRRARYMTCICGGMSLHFTDGWCSCWICRQQTNGLQQVDQDILSVATWACGDHDHDQFRAIVDDQDTMGWADPTNNHGDSLSHLDSQDYLDTNGDWQPAYDLTSTVLHDLWGEWSGQDDLLAA
jgi:hypothetical protein